MDFIDWCHHVLGVLEEQRFHSHLSDYELQEMLFGEVSKQPQFHESKIRHSMFDALWALRDAGLAEEGNHRKWKITPFGRKVLSDPVEFWSSICAEQLESEEEKLLRLVNRLSPHENSNPNYVWLESVTSDIVLAEFNIDPPPGKTNEHLAALNKYVSELPKLLSEGGLLKTRPRIGYHNDLTPTYRGSVWETRRGFTIESRFIDELVDEWETTNIEFKRVLALDTQKQKGEFAKDALGLVTTKSSGPRFMIIGFDDKSREYFGPPDPSVTQNRIEQVLANLTDPVVIISYEIVECRVGKVGKLEFMRQPEKLPYQALQDVFDEKGKKVLEQGKVYVRHGSQTESPTELELEALIAEGQHARS